MVTNKSKLESLTPEQWREVRELHDRYLRRAVCPESEWASEEETIEAIRELGRLLGKPNLKHIFIARGPIAAQALCRKHGPPRDGPYPTDRIGNINVGWMSYYSNSLQLADRGILTPVKPIPAKTRTLRDAYERLLDSRIYAMHTFQHGVVAYRNPLEAHFTSRPNPHTGGVILGVLHNDSGPAAVWADGYKQYAYRGVRLDGKEWIVEQPHLITVKKAIEEANVEIRRVMMEQMGTERIAANVDHLKVIDSVKEVDVDGNEIVCDLIQVGVEGIDMRFTRVTCPSTHKVVYERVPASAGNEYAKVRAWQWGLKKPFRASDSLWET